MKSRTSLQSRSGWIGVCSRRHGLVLLGGLLGVQRAQLARPRGVALGRDLALGLGAELLEHRARVARDGHVHLAVVAELGRVDVHVDDLEIGGEARRAAELDHPVEARADRQHHVGLGEGLAPRVQERQRVVLGDEAARDRRRVEGDAGGLHEGLERGGAVRPPHAAARDDHRPLGLARGARRPRAPRRDRPGCAAPAATGRDSGAAPPRPSRPGCRRACRCTPGPGRPLVAWRNAVSTTSGMRLAS